MVRVITVRVSVTVNGFRVRVKVSIFGPDVCRPNGVWPKRLVTKENNVSSS